MSAAIDRLILYLATERGLSVNYQLSVRQSLDGFVQWVARKKIEEVEPVDLQLLTAYLMARKSDGISSATIRLNGIALKIFFRFLCARGFLPKDIADGLMVPRLDSSLPGTLSEEETEHL
ncbi:MAG TPA: site-specific integrase, partial [Verrucomicrobiales bacterium]|nr:site-specific integrase [Verrucomicrobiales bacterium]